MGVAFNAKWRTVSSSCTATVCEAICTVKQAVSLHQEPAANITTSDYRASMFETMQPCEIGQMRSGR